MLGLTLYQLHARKDQRDLSGRILLETAQVGTSLHGIDPEGVQRD